MADQTINFVKVWKLGVKSWLSRGNALETGRSRDGSALPCGFHYQSLLTTLSLTEVHTGKWLTFRALVAMTTSV